MFKGKFGVPRQFAEKREWRIAQHLTGKGFVSEPGGPDNSLPLLPREELFTLMRPEIKGVRPVLRQDWLTER